LNLKVSNVYKEFFQNKNRYCILYGGAGSGKSYVTAQKILLRILTESNHKILVVRKVARTIRESVFDLFKEVISKLELNDIFKINHTNMSIECLLNGNRIVFFGLDNREKIKSIAGISSIWIEEATELEEEDLDQMDLRLRGNNPNYKQVIITFNPVSAHHWIKKKFFDFTPEDTYILKTTYLDNPFAGEQYKIVMNRLKRDNPEYYKIYALGEWGSLEGLVYESYKTIDEMPKYFEKEFIGLDFGYNHPYAMVHRRIDENKLFTDELLYTQMWDNDKVIEYVNEKYPWIKKKQIKIWADSARPDLISKWKAKGYNIASANKSVFEGIMAVKSFELYVTKQSSNILKELGLYAWKKDKDGKTLDEPIKLNDDAMDAIRYSITPYIKSRGSTKSLKLKGL
jgi:phage terminase large subunit